jgi:hypothetical protein
METRIQAVLNTSGTAVVMLLDIQMSVDLPGLYQIYRYFDPACTDSIVSVTYNTPNISKWQHFLVGTWTRVYWNVLYGRLLSCFQENLPVPYNQICI